MTLRVWMIASDWKRVGFNHDCRQALNSFQLVSVPKALINYPASVVRRIAQSLAKAVNR